MTSQLKTRKKKRVQRITIAAALVLALVGIFLYRQLSPEELPQVRVAEIERGDIRSLFYATAEIVPGDIVEHQAPVPQKVLEVMVEPQQQVREGQVLARLDQQELLDEYESARERRRDIESSLADADAAEQARIDAAEQTRQAIEQDIGDLSTRLSMAASQLTRLASTEPAQIQVDDELESDLARLLAQGDPENPEETIAALLARLQQATRLVENPEYASVLSQLENELQLASETAGSVLSGLATAALSGSAVLPQELSDPIGALAELPFALQDPLTQAIEQEAAAREQWQASQPYLTAKISGLVADIHVRPGDYAGTQPLSSATGLDAFLDEPSLAWQAPSAAAFTIYDNMRPQAVFHVGRFDAGRLEEGMPVDYEDDGRLYTGTILRVGKIASRGSAGQLEALEFFGDSGGFSTEPQVEIEMSLEGEGLHELVPGFWIDAEIEFAVAENALMLPAEAMRRELDQYYVFKVDKEGQVIRQSLTPGIQSELFIEVVAGLDENDRVILNPPLDLQEGMEVEVMVDA